MKNFVRISFFWLEIISMTGISLSFFVSAISREMGKIPFTNAGTSIDILLGVWFLFVLILFLVATHNHLWNSK